MKIPRTRPDAPLSEVDKESPAYKNQNTAWWDASQLYGSNEAATTSLREGAINGKLAMKKEGQEDFLLRDANNLPKTGFNQNWWLGLELLHTLFALEHNAICDMLLAKNPEWKRYRTTFNIFSVRTNITQVISFLIRLESSIVH